MTPRRLLPYLVVFLVVVGVFAGLKWRQGQKEAQEQKAKQVFSVTAPEISAIALQRGAEVIQLARQGQSWEITKPLKAKADAATVENLVKALVELKSQRDLGPGDFKGFGLDQPGLVLTFTAGAKEHRLSLGQAVPGNRGHYARKDEQPNILIFAAGTREALDKQLPALRDKTLIAFKPDEVKSFKIRTAKTQVDLERTGPKAWRLPGQPDFKVRPEQADNLLRQIEAARVQEFLPTPPKDPKALGLAPQARTEVTLTTPQGPITLFLGSETGNEVYARLGAQGDVVKVIKSLPTQLAQGLDKLEDRRLWSGGAAVVQKMVWGTPDKLWTAVREKNAWKLTGPDKAEAKQTGPTMEAALYRLTNLEYSSLLPQAGAPGKPGFAVEFQDQAGKPLFRLEEVGKKGETGVEVRTKTGETTVGAVVPQQTFASCQAELNRLTTPLPAPQPAK